MFLNETKPDLDKTLEHHGVLGMKWGRSRARATTAQIHGARGRLNAQGRNYENKDLKNAFTKDPKKRAAGKQELAKMKMDILKNPDRVVASRMTKGEKAVAMLLFGPAGVAAVGITSAQSRRIERKQELGKYDKKK